MKENKNYSDYTMEDFLQDDFFIHSMINPTEASVAFWENYLDEHKENKENYLFACFYIQSAQVKKKYPSDKDRKEIWKNIERINHSNTKKRFRSIIIGISTAASITLIFLVSRFITPMSDSDRLLSVAEREKEIDFSSEKARLIVSGDQSYLLEGKEFNIVHDSSAIIINETKIEPARKNGSRSSVNQLIIPFGKRSSVTFSDGTYAYVNAGSRVFYPSEFDKNERMIYVEGEVYLNVVPDRERPFVVKTSQMNIEVLGTSFDVKAYHSDDSQQVVLLSGSVKIITKEKQTYTLRPDDLFVNTNGNGNVNRVNTDKYISWIEGYYIYESEPLEMILKHLSRYYGKEIACDEASGKLKISGKIDLKENLDLVLKNFTHITPTQLLQENGKNKIIQYQ